MVAAMSGSHLVSLEQIADMLRARMMELPAAWRLDGERDGNDFVCLSPFRGDRKRGSFRICVAGSHAGLIKDFASGETWSALRFTAQLMFGGDQVMAIKWAKGWLGLDGTNPDSLRQTRVAVERAQAAGAVEDEKAVKRRGQANRLYLEAVEAWWDSPVYWYLRGRGVDLEKLPFARRWFRGVRFHPALFNKETGREHAAMVASINGADGRFLSIHRTWLERQSNGRWEKHPGIADNKKTLGLYKGQSGMIRLWRGIKVDPVTGEIKRLPAWRDMKPGAWLDLTEGIEDALSVAVDMPEARVGAGVCLDNMVSMTWPEAIEGICVWRQNDAAGSAAADRFPQLEANYLAQGKQVALPPIPAHLKDINDFVRERAG